MDKSIIKSIQDDAEMMMAAVCALNAVKDHSQEEPDPAVLQRYSLMKKNWIDIYETHRARIKDTMRLLDQIPKL